ncbi:hypothetical protein [Dietzia maris]|uniref:hypothetical protein n=1 Tax=Dietzia maris TaxID=37915 RepID=UPI00232B2E79|nr:hypothetical protein [Dietzia maris]
MSTDTIAAVAALIAAIATPFTSWLVTRTSRKDTRQNIARDLAILKDLDPASEVHMALQARVNRDITKLVNQADIRDEIGPVWRKYFGAIGLFTLAGALGWVQRQEWIPEDAGTSIAIVRVGCWIIGVFLAIQLIIKMASVFWMAAPLGRLVAVNQFLKLKFAYLKIVSFRLDRRMKKTAKRYEELTAEMTEYLKGDLAELFRRGVTLEKVLQLLPMGPHSESEQEAIDTIRDEVTRQYEMVASEDQGRPGASS